MRDVEAPLDGGCFCGAVRFRLTRVPFFVSCCHCTDCRRQSGAAFATYAAVETAALILRQGAPVPVRLKTDAGTVHETWRCPVCQAPVWDDYGVPGVSFARVSAMDAAADLAPNVHIFVRSKLAWVRLPADVPAFEGDFDPKSVYPAESWARRMAAADATDKPPPSA